MWSSFSKYLWNQPVINSEKILCETTVWVDSSPSTLQVLQKQSEQESSTDSTDSSSWIYTLKIQPKTTGKLLLFTINDKTLVKTAPAPPPAIKPPLRDICFTFSFTAPAKIFSFVLPNSQQASDLGMCICRCIYEARNKRSGAHLSLVELLPMLQTADFSTSNKIFKQVSIVPLPSATNKISPGSEVVLELRSCLFNYRLASSKTTIPLPSGLLRIYCEFETFRYWINIYQENSNQLNLIASCLISQQMYPQFSDSLAIVDFYYQTAKESFVIGVKFQNWADREHFLSTLCQALFESSRKQKVAKTRAKQEISWMLNFYGQRKQLESVKTIEITESYPEYSGDTGEYFIFDSDDERLEIEYDSVSDSVSGTVSDSISDTKYNLTKAPLISTAPTLYSGKPFSQMVVGNVSNKTFALQGDSIKIFDTQKDDVAYQSSIQLPEKSQPNSLLLHNQNAHILLTNKIYPESIDQIDTETGKVVETWKSKNLPIESLFYKTKMGELSSDSVIAGLNKNSFFLLDSRLPTSSKVVLRQDKQALDPINPFVGKKYTSKVDFTCASTSHQGNVALASNTGEIRFYTSIDNKRAKTHLPGTGDPISHLDITDDGQYVLATCALYLLLIPTVNSETNVSGFKTSLGDQKPTPIRLGLKFDDIPKCAGHSGTIAFHQAKFDFRSSGEKYIVCSTGSWMIVWNFQAILKGNHFAYKMYKQQSRVVSQSFQYNTDRILLLDNSGVYSAIKRRK